MKKIYYKLSEKQKKVFKNTLKITLTIFFTYWVIVKTDWVEVLIYLQIIKLWHIGLYLILLITGMFICSYRWKILAQFKGINLPVWEFFRLYITGTFVNNFMPSIIAGDAYKAVMVGKESGEYSESAAAVMMDRITGLIATMILAIFFSVINLKTTLENPVLWVANILIILSLCSDFLIVGLKKIKRLKKWFFDVLPKFIIDFILALYRFNNKTGVIGKAIWYSIIFSVLSVAVQNYILFWGMGIDIGLLDFMSVIFIASIVSSLPLTINNIGLNEWAYITLFGIFGVSSGAAVAVAVVGRILKMFVSFLALPFYLKSKKML